MPVQQASFYWRNNEPGGLGFTFRAPIFKPAELEEMFLSKNVKDFYRHSDLALGSGVVKDYITQLSALGQDKVAGRRLTIQQACLAALNIMWLSSRGFIPNDEFNGVEFIGVTT